MKTEEEIKRAIELLNLLLEDQVKLQKFPDKDVKANVAGVIWGLHWMMGQPHTLGLEKLLNDIEAAKNGPGYNPHTIVTE